MQIKVAQEKMNISAYILTGIVRIDYSDNRD